MQKKCKKNSKRIDPRVSKTNNGKAMILSKCAICHSRKSRFIKKQEASGILSNLGLNRPLIKTPLLFHIPYCFRIIKLMK